MTWRVRLMALVAVATALAIVIPASLLASMIGLPWGLIPGALSVWGSAELVIWIATRDCWNEGEPRGNDGLTDAERHERAERWRNGAGRAPSRAEMQEIRRRLLGPSE